MFLRHCIISGCFQGHDRILQSILVSETKVLGRVKFWSGVGTRGNIRGSPKTLGLIVCATCCASPSSRWWESSLNKRKSNKHQNHWNLTLRDLEYSNIYSSPFNGFTPQHKYKLHGGAGKLKGSLKSVRLNLWGPGMSEKLHPIVVKMMVDRPTDWRFHPWSHHSTSMAKKRICLLYKENDFEIRRLLFSDLEVTEKQERKSYRKGVNHDSESACLVPGSEALTWKWLVPFLVFLALH